MDDRDDDLKILLSALKDGGMYVGEEEEEEDEEDDEDEDVHDDNVKTDLACPFCSEDFDMLGLCCHIDSEHRIEAKTGICPLCATKVRTNMATHVIVQHETLSLLRKELLSVYLEKKSSHVSSSSNMETNQLLLSFVGNQQPAKRSPTRQHCTSAEPSLSKNSLDDHISESSELSGKLDEFKNKASLDILPMLDL
ncbi:hypothetical protein KY284_036827 [Solanum tuberosum]|nr:hypothetical protein KY284_036827 [Solanum tuberosum]